MHVRLKITLLISILMSILLAVFCGVIYYFFYTIRLENMKAHLKNHVQTTANMMYDTTTFTPALMQKMDAISVMPMQQKTIQVYDANNERIFSNSDIQGDTLTISSAILQKARMDHEYFFKTGSREALACYDLKNPVHPIIIAASYDEEGLRNLRHLEIILWVTFFSGMAISVIAGYFISKILLKPIRKIANDVHEISAQNLEHRIETGNAKDEWTFLIETLNELLDRLQQSFEMQRRFISSASHELSTPLTSISSQLEVSLQRERGAKEYRGIMQSIYQDVRSLNKLTQTLLQFATVADIKGGIEISTIRIDEILMQLPREISRINEAYSVKLDFEQLPENVERLLVFGNADLLFSAIKNVVNNACKYSDNHCALVKLMVQPKEIFVVVEDSGKGINAADLKNIFQPFYRSEDSKSITGFGVGLPLAYRIIKLHKGQINVNSILEKGTTFLIKLPIAENVRQKKQNGE